MGAAGQVGVSAAVPSGVRSQTGYQPDAGAVRAARRFVEQRLHDLGLERLAEDAGLLTSELAANAVLHARSPFVVVVQEVPCGARVEVHDRSPAVPVMTAARPSATSGRGLVLVESVAARWGCELDPGRGKRVWCELTTEERGDGPSEEDLLALWGDLADAPPAGPGPLDAGLAGPGGPGGPGGSEGLREVVVAGMPVQDLLAAEEHVDDVVRELQLVLLDPEPPAGPVSAERAVAERLDVAAREVAGVRAQVREQLDGAAAAGQGHVDLRLLLPAGAAGSTARYRDALEDAEALSARGELLALGDLDRHAAVRRRHLDEVVAQLAAAEG